ncbi:hypothetical protein Gohar_014057 [Gossypium harknessii]|uniref:DC1 domain-containing protein n=1 Tax=Gossypium harknessii TaxID=34285 RepID=A0A7J9H3G3_9ROSI|nr:hypothetical protein [Gossypium harknessii]
MYEVTEELKGENYCSGCRMDSFIEDDSGKYYCDFCEEERNPNDDIYYCEECNGQTIAHIECVLAEVHEVSFKW